MVTTAWKQGTMTKLLKAKLSSNSQELITKTTNIWKKLSSNDSTHNSLAHIPKYNNPTVIQWFLAIWDFPDALGSFKPQKPWNTTPRTREALEKKRGERIFGEKWQHGKKLIRQLFWRCLTTYTVKVDDWSMNDIMRKIQQPLLEIAVDDFNLAPLAIYNESYQPPLYEIAPCWNRLHLFTAMEKKLPPIGNTKIWSHSKMLMEYDLTSNHTPHYPLKNDGSPTS